MPCKHTSSLVLCDFAGTSPSWRTVWVQRWKQPVPTPPPDPSSCWRTSASTLPRREKARMPPETRWVSYLSVCYNLRRIYLYLTLWWKPCFHLFIHNEAPLRFGMPKTCRPKINNSRSRRVKSLQKHLRVSVQQTLQGHLEENAQSLQLQCPPEIVESPSDDIIVRSAAETRGCVCNLLPVATYCSALMLA